MIFSMKIYLDNNATTPLDPRVLEAVTAELKSCPEWDVGLARVVSRIGSPPVLVAGTMVLTAASVSHPRALLWAGAYILMAVVPSVLHLVWLMHRGHIAGLDVPLREHRIGPFALTTACYTLAWVVLRVGGAPLPMVALAGALALQTLIVLGVTLRWKISVHCATASGIAVLAWSLTGLWLPMFLVVSLVAWSRVRMRRHTVSEAVAGLSLGFIVFRALVSCV